MQTNSLKNLIVSLYYANSNNKKHYYIKHNNKIKHIIKNKKQSLFTTYKKLYKHNFKQITFKQLQTLNNTFIIQSYYSTYKSIMCKAYKHNLIV